MAELDKKFERAREYTDGGNEELAIKLYQEILAEKEDWSVIHYNLGLIHKYNNDWKKSFDYNLRAVELDSEDDASHWNLGIAATMLGEWKIARKSWNKFGMNYEVTDEEIWGKVGIAPIRLNPDTNAEVILATRIDSARAVINSIPFPDSGHGFNDLILNDGAPMGKRLRSEKEYSVFNELELLKKNKL